jgi:hypothetical protein
MTSNHILPSHLRLCSLSVASSGYSTYFFAPDPMEVVMVTLGNALLSCLGYECNESCPAYKHLSIVAHVGIPHSTIDTTLRHIPEVCHLH